VNLSRTQIQLQVGQGLVNYDVLKDSEANVEIDTPNVAIRPHMNEGSYRITVNSNGEPSWTFARAPPISPRRRQHSR